MMKRKVIPFLLLTVLLAVFAAGALADQDFTFDRSVNTLFEGETLRLTLLRQGEAADGTIEYKSSNQRIATVDDTGTVTLLSETQLSVSWVSPSFLT